MISINNLHKIVIYLLDIQGLEFFFFFLSRLKQKRKTGEGKEEGSSTAACDAQWVTVGEKLHFVGSIFSVCEMSAGT